MGSFYIFCGLSFDWLLLGVLWYLFKQGLLGLFFFYRNRLYLLHRLLLLECACCFLSLLFLICFELFFGENEPALRVSYGIPDLPLLLLGEIVLIALIHVEKF